MTRIICSVVSLLLLVVGVAAVDRWSNTVNIPEDELEEIRETRAKFPAMNVRSQLCNCDVQVRKMDFGDLTYPRVLVTRECVSTPCIQQLRTCRNVSYNVNVTMFRKIENYGERNALPRPEICYKVWETVPITLSADCVPVTV